MTRMHAAEPAVVVLLCVRVHSLSCYRVKTLFVFHTYIHPHQSHCLRILFLCRVFGSLEELACSGQ